MKNLFTSLVCLCLTAVLFANDTKTEFEKLKTLEGKWVGTLERTDGTSDFLNLEYSITSNGSALLEESNTGGIEMLSIFNTQNNQLLVTHYCGLQNKPIALLESEENGTFYFKTDHSRSGLDSTKEAFVGYWKFVIINDTTLQYEYNVIGPKGVAFTAKAEMKKIG
jgi:hypothetical protein